MADKSASRSASSIRSLQFGVGRPALSGINWTLATRFAWLDVGRLFYCSCPASSSKSGIALVMVLGILSVMVILAVAFAISMRTERVASGNYADSVRARQLVQVGLARAMNDLATNLGIGGLTSSVAHVYPPWSVTNSYAANYVNTSTDVYLLASTRANQATNFVPRALWQVAVNADNLNADHHWLPIDRIIAGTDTNGNPVVLESNRLGRVKYLILNCSGLLDANFVGGATRGVGTNPNEIAINGMAEIQNAATYFTTRNDKYRYETQEELAELNKAAFNGSPSNFTVYSHAPPGFWTNNTINTISNQVNLAGTYGDIGSREVAITNGFVKAGFTPAQAGILYNNLRNYMGAGTVPLMGSNADFTYFVKAVPMINEILLESVVNGVGTRNIVWVEVWYPFVTPPSCNFQLRVQVDISAGNSIPEQIVNIPAGSLPLAWFPFEGADLVNNSPYRFTIRKAEVLNDTLAIVDMLMGSSTNTPSAPVNRGGNKVSYQCIDPRLNWDLFNTQLWDVITGPAPGTLGQINTNTITYMYNNSLCDQDVAMYLPASNQPLSSVGELGYLAYDTWRTIKLYGTDCQRVFDVFAIGPNLSNTYVTNTIWRGRVNPNTRETNVLSTVFSDMLLDEYPGQAATNLTAIQILAIVNNIQSNVYTNLSDVGRNFTAFPASADNELKREAIFRNSVGLLSVRQNLFTVIIEAQAASGGNIPRNPVRQRAVALVWRDPYTGEMFVRSIKWLKD